MWSFVGKMSSQILGLTGLKESWLYVHNDIFAFVEIANSLFYSWKLNYSVVKQTQWMSRRLGPVSCWFSGAGGLVINEKNQVLAVCERYSRKKHWKLPGGMVDRSKY